MKIILDIGGRDAIPVRAIPLVTDWETMWPDELADRLASGIAMTAYHLDGGAVKAIAPRWWRNETCQKLKALLTSVEAAQSSGAITEEEGALRWRNEALPLLPAGTFVWRDEFELQHIARDTSDGLDVLDQPHSVAIKVGKEKAIPDSEHDRNVALNLEPFIESPELHKTIMAGFDQVPAVVAGVEQSGADQRRQQFLDRVLDPENVAMLQAAEAATDATARRVLRGDLVESAGPPLSPGTLQALIDGAEPPVDHANSHPRAASSGSESVRSHTTKTVRPRALHPAVKKAMRECVDQADEAEVWNVLHRHCVEEMPPFSGVSADGHLEYTENNKKKKLRRGNFKRLHQGILGREAG